MEIYVLRLFLPLGCDSVVLLVELPDDLTDLVHEEGDRPLEEVNVAGQVEGVVYVFVLLDIHFLIFNQNNSTLIMILATVVWRAENCDHRGERCCAAPSVHLVPIDLHLVSSDNRDVIILLEHFLHGLQTEFD